MDFKKLTLLFAFISLSATVVFAQSGKLNRADNKFKRLDYQKASELYIEVAQETHGGYPALMAAECFRLMNQPGKATSWYSLAIRRNAHDPIHLLYYAQALQQTRQYDEAKKWFVRYNKLKPNDSRGWRGIMACDEVDEILNEETGLKATPVNRLNSEYGDFGPVLFEDKLILASDRDDRSKFIQALSADRPSFLNIYEAKRTDNGFKKPKPFKPLPNTKYHDGPAAFSPDGNMLFFTRSNTEVSTFGTKAQGNEDNIVLLEIMYCTYDDSTGKWSQPQSLPFKSKDYTIAHPAVSPDGEYLYFSSDKPGGNGGTDIWRAAINDGDWGKPEPVKGNVNTEGEEMFPSFDDKGQLYFASNAHPGLGGLDIFKATYSANRDRFEDVENLGAPINSSRDDFSIYVMDELNGYFASNRPGGKGGDDIYRYETTQAVWLITVKEDEEGAPVPGAMVKYGGYNNWKDSTKTNEKGVAVFTVNGDDRYQLRAEKHHFYPGRENVAVDEVEAGDTFRSEISMRRSVDVMLAGRVEDGETEPISDVNVKVSGIGHYFRKEVTPDANGNFEVRLEPGKKYSVETRKDGYMMDREKLVTKHHKPIAEYEMTLKLYKLEKDKPIVLQNIYFDYNKAEIREAASEDLATLLETLQQNPELLVEISAHTDSRGSDRYNEYLSQERAQSVVDWLISRGVAPDRLTAKGYGEYQLVNDCDDNTPCSETKHQENRRAELKVVGFSDSSAPTAEGAAWDIHADQIPLYVPDSAEIINQQKERPGFTDDLREYVTSLEGNSSQKEGLIWAKSLEGNVYVVQYAASRSEDEKFPKAEKLGPQVREKAGQYLRFMIGPFETREEALQMADEVRKVGYKNAFLVNYIDGQRQ